MRGPGFFFGPSGKSECTCTTAHSRLLKMSAVARRCEYVGIGMNKLVSALLSKQNRNSRDRFREGSFPSFRCNCLPRARHRQLGLLFEFPLQKHDIPAVKGHVNAYYAFIHTALVWQYTADSRMTLLIESRQISWSDCHGGSQSPE